jgi:sec-independent protein translocase protein TatA
MIGGIGMPELIVILVIVLIIFGANKLPQIGEGLGKGIRNFKKGIKDKEEINITSKKRKRLEKKPKGKRPFRIIHKGKLQREEVPP